jgi:hypothetical protein
MKLSSHRIVRVLCSTILLAAYGPFCFRLLMPLMNYAVNYRYIATVLCENKDQPQKQCNGKCFLNKQIKQTSGQSSKEEGNGLNLKNSQEEYFHIFVSVDFSTLTPFGKIVPLSNPSRLTPLSRENPSPPPRSSLSF